MASFGEVLAEFKRAEAPESIFPLLEDTPLCNALMAWKSVRVAYKTPHDCEETTDLLKWEWLWSQVEWDLGDFGIVAGCKGQDAPGMIARLRGLRLIYPDGSINNFSKQYLSSLIMQKIQGKKKPAPTVVPAPATSAVK
jgi:hypothetical protein